MVIVIHYGEGSEDAAFPVKDGSNLVWIVKHYGSNEIRFQAP